MKRNSFFIPSQLTILLTGMNEGGSFSAGGDIGGGGGMQEALPNPILEEEEDFLLPDGGMVSIGENDITVMPSDDSLADDNLPSFWRKKREENLRIV